MEKEEYSSWLKPDPLYRDKAICKLCMKTFAISTMEKPALKSHASSEKHQNALRMSQGMESASDYFKGKDSVAKEQKKNLLEVEKQSGETSLSSENQSSIMKYALSKEQSKAEILWALKLVMSHFSHSSSKDIADILEHCFPDSRIEHELLSHQTFIPDLLWNCSFL